MSAQGTKSTRVLFIGIVQDGKVVQERPLGAGEDVTVGSSTKASFVVEDTGLGAEDFLLFACRDGQYRLRFNKEVKGRITSLGEKVELAKALKDGSAADEADGVVSIPLNDADKGKIKVGPVTLLFKFVDPPVVAPPPAPIEKLDFRARLFFDEDDPVFTRSLGFWSALAVIFAIWVRVTPAPPVDVEKMSKRVITIAKIEKPAEVVAPVDEGQKPEEAKKDDDAAAEAETKPDESKTPDKPKNEVDRAARIEQAKSELSNDAMFAALNASAIGVLGVGKGTTTGHVSGDLSAQLSKAQASGGSGGDGTALKTGTVGGSGDGAPRDIGQVQQGKAGNADLGTAPTIKTSVKTEDLDVGDGVDATDVGKVVRANQGSLKWCYDNALKANPTLAGKIVIRWEIAGGAASEVDIVDNTTGDSAFGDCVLKKVRRWQFASVADGEAKTTFVFAPQD
jgi:hypothetical protein